MAGLQWRRAADILRGKTIQEVSMRKMYVLAILTALLVVGALAQSDSDYQSWMKSNPVNLASLNKNIAAKDGAAAASDAQKLEATFKQVCSVDWTQSFP